MPDNGQNTIYFNSESVLALADEVKVNGISTVFEKRFSLASEQRLFGHCGGNYRPLVVGCWPPLYSEDTTNCAVNVVETLYIEQNRARTKKREKKRDFTEKFFILV
ncbi:hypothetical protein [Thermincola ferriacetica]